MHAADARYHLNCSSRCVGDNNNNNKQEVTVTMSRNVDSNSDEAFTDVVMSLDTIMSVIYY